MKDDSVEKAFKEHIEHLKKVHPAVREHVMRGVKATAEQVGADQSEDGAPSLSNIMGKEY